MSNGVWWASQDFWRKCAIFVTAGMFLVLILLTFHSMAAITAGQDRVPPYSVINHRIDYVFDEGAEHEGAGNRRGSAAVR